MACLLGVHFLTVVTVNCAATQKDRLGALPEHAILLVSKGSPELCHMTLKDMLGALPEHVILLVFKCSP
jgi:hypothetical protein